MGEGDNLVLGGHNGLGGGWARNNQGSLLSSSGGVALNGGGDLLESSHGSRDTRGENGLLDGWAWAVGNGQSLGLGCSVSDTLESGSGCDWADCGGFGDNLGNLGGERRIGALGLDGSAWACVGDGQDSGLTDTSQYS